MLSSPMLKQELHVRLELLSAAKLQEVLDFVSFLLSQQDRVASEVSTTVDSVRPDDDPLLEFIGAVSHGALAQGIDEEVYSV